MVDPVNHKNTFLGGPKPKKSGKSGFLDPDLGSKTPKSGSKTPQIGGPKPPIWGPNPRFWGPGEGPGPLGEEVLTLPGEGSPWEMTSLVKIVKIPKCTANIHSFLPSQTLQICAQCKFTHIFWEKRFLIALNFPKPPLPDPKHRLICLIYRVILVLAVPASWPGRSGPQFDHPRDPPDRILASREGPWDDQIKGPDPSQMPPVYCDLS